ncbi:hypothetical protein MLD38_036120 [Melastoma candidum]|uniref:Uncharacterized protein n=1 Tax=Melastoma candidum TaxID=119954 RepID=A0ACB9LJE7_9MYRT|nr:hypothetical protein MLD38_036120 [Melastoma candidum]
MAPTTDVHASPSKKARTEKEEQVVEKPYVAPSFMCFFGEEPDDFDVECGPLCEEYDKLVSDFKDKFDSTGGFDVPRIPLDLLNYVPARIQSSIPADQNDEEKEDVMNVLNTAIRHYKKNNNKMTDLVPVEILHSASELCGTWLYYITFKARDSYGVVRTYETLIYPMFREDDAILEIFRVKPYAPVERPGRNEVEKLLA